MSYLELLRPYQWIKNLLIFAPLIFARELLSKDKFWTALFAFVAFSLIASAGYIFNDLLDCQQDAKHPRKKLRPLPAGRVSPKEAWVILGVLVGLGVGVSFSLPLEFRLFTSLYAGLSFLYSVWLKQVAVVDLLLVSGFYVLRVLAGGAATHTLVSQWLILVIASGALLLVTGKRVSELTQSNPRPVLQKYTVEFLNQVLTIAAGLTLIAYGLYTILGTYSRGTFFSLIFVLYAVVRYLWLVREENYWVEYPEKILVHDRVLLMTVLGWGVYMWLVLYHGI